MPSIVVKYLPRTDTKGPRYVAISNSGVRATYSMDMSDKSDMDAEKAAVAACCEKMGWADGNSSVWHRSGMSQLSGCVAAYVWPNDTYRVEYDARESSCYKLVREDVSRAYSEEPKSE